MPMPGVHKKSPEPYGSGDLILWQMRDSNPRRRCQLIYSQPPLAARVICRTSKEVTPDHRFVSDPVSASKTTLQNFCRRIESRPRSLKTGENLRPHQISGQPTWPRN